MKKLLIVMLVVMGCTQKESTMFRIMSANETGIDFNNIIDNSDSINILNYLYYYNGGGVGAGDLNNDGLIDLFFAGNKRDDALYLNKGNWKFEDVTQSAGINREGWSTGVSLVDLNADGWLDIYISRAGGFKNSHYRKNVFYLNNTDGTFTEKAEVFGIADTSYTTHSAFFDYDLDGDLDLYVMNHANDRERVNTPVPTVNTGEMMSNDHLYENTGNGFRDVSVDAGVLTEGYGLGLAIADFNNDGWPDIYVANDFVFSDLLYINNQDGTFTNRARQYIPHQPYNAMGCDLGDINNDGKLDLITLDMLPEDNERQKSMIGAMNYYKFDLIIKGGFDHQYMRNMLYEQGKSGFEEIGRLAGVHATDWSWTPLFGDFDNDTHTDLFIANGYYKDITDKDFIMFSNNMTMFTSREIGDSLIMQELDRLPETKMTNYIFKNFGNNRFKDMRAEWTGLEKTLSNGAVYADLDNDGDLDLITNDMNSPAGMYRNEIPVKGHYVKIELKGAGDNVGAIGSEVAVYLGDKILKKNYSPYRGFMGSIHTPLHFGLGNSSKIDSLRVNWPDGTISTFYDLPIDTLSSLSQGAGSMPTPEKFSNRHQVSIDGLHYKHSEDFMVDFNAQPLLLDMLSREGPALAVGDLDMDGLEDVFIGGAKNKPSFILYQKSNGFTAVELTNEKNFEDVEATIVDFNGDGLNDLLVLSGGYENLQDRIYFGKPDKTLSESVLLPIEPVSPGCLVLNDFDEDGDLDVFIGGRFTPNEYPKAPISHLLINEGGEFSSKEGWPKQLGMITDVDWADMDGDGDADLILAREWQSILVIYNNDLDFSREVEIGASGWWNSIKVLDIDNDSDLDIVAGNFGLNNEFNVSESTPLEMYAKDIDQNGSIDPIITRYYEDQPYPIHVRDALINQMPFIKGRIPKYKSYATITLNQLFTEEELEGATYFKTTEMRSGLFIQDQGGFSFTPFPDRVQYGPVQDIEADDFNKDGLVDLVIVGNDFDLEVLGGRQDALGGLVLVQEQPGVFYVSELFSLGNARKINKLYYQGSKYWLVAQNNDSLKVVRLGGTRLQ